MKPTAWSIIRLVILGAIINVAVAWWCVARLPMPPTVEHLHQRVRWPHPPRDGWPAARLQWLRTTGLFKVTITRSLPETDLSRISVHVRPGPKAVAPVQPASFTRTNTAQQMDVEAGFPLRSVRMYGMQEYTSGGTNLTDSWTGSMPTWFTNRADTAAAVPIKGLPLIPMPVGFAINTMMYALMLMVMGRLIRNARRTWRTHRHRCPACAYPIGVSPLCTECGATLVQGMSRH